MEHIYDLIILGGGPAGYSAALYGARAGLDTLVIEKISAGGQMALTDIIDNYPGFDQGVDGFELSMKMQAGAERFGAKTEYAEVVSTDFSDKIKKIQTSSGELLSKTVIIASGAEPRELGVPNEKELIGSGIHYCAHCDGNFYKNKTVAVIGGGNTAAADALYLSRLANKVYLVHRRDSLRATKIYHQPLLNAANVEFVWDSIVEEFIAEEKVTGIKIKNVKNNTTSEIKCDGVFVSIGRKPTTDFLDKNLKFDESGYVVANEDCKTNISGVFVAGGVRTKEVRQVITAAADGAIAAIAAEEYLSV